MRRDEEYTANAADTLEPAERASALEDRCGLLNLDEPRLDLADRVRRRATPLDLREGPLAMRDRVRRMNPVQKCLDRAQYCERAASVVTSPRAIATFLGAARSWREMAEQYRKREGIDALISDRDSGLFRADYYQAS